MRAGGFISNYWLQGPCINCVKWIEGTPQACIKRTRRTENQKSLFRRTNSSWKKSYLPQRISSHLECPIPLFCVFSPCCAFLLTKIKEFHPMQYEHFIPSRAFHPTEHLIPARVLHPLLRIYSHFILVLIISPLSILSQLSASHPTVMYFSFTTGNLILLQFFSFYR